MFKKEDNSKIGAYISYLISKRFKSARQFCKAYIECQGREANDDEIRKMANRLSQIKKGAKSIQIDDLQYFTQLLDVTCEEILSAGNYFIPDERMTNYKFAFTKDKDIWEQYINRPDKIILNTDEYGKTVIDYALEYKNYELLKFLTDNKYIWFVGDSPKDYWTSFGAGTSIERKPIYQIDNLNIKLAESDNLRRQMISLAIDNHDFDMLTTLRAREIPSLYQACYLSCTSPDCDSYYDQQMLAHITLAGNQVLDYFSEEFEIKDRVGRINRFIFPYIGQLIDLLIKKKHPYVEILLKRCIEHNQMTYHRVNTLINNSSNAFDEEIRKYCKEDLTKDILRYFDFYENGNIVCFRDTFTIDGIITNIVYIKERTENSFIQSLIEQTNSLYEDVKKLKH